MVTGAVQVLEAHRHHKREKEGIKARLCGRTPVEERTRLVEPSSLPPEICVTSQYHTRAH
jgi:hypothetical protein